jgi:hypothetical protein
MYIRFKAYDKKMNNDYNKPLFYLEFEGNHALELSILRIIQHFFGYSKSDKINQKIQEIKDILLEES